MPRINAFSRNVNSINLKIFPKDGGIQKFDRKFNKFCSGWEGEGRGNDIPGEGRICLGDQRYGETIQSNYKMNCIQDNLLHHTKKAYFSRISFSQQFAFL